MARGMGMALVGTYLFLAELDSEVPLFSMGCLVTSFLGASIARMWGWPRRRRPSYGGLGTVSPCAPRLMS